MWTTLLLAIIASLILVYLPGYLFVRAFQISRVSAFIIAPVFSTLITTMLGIGLEKAQVSCSGGTLFVLSVVFGAALYLIGLLFTRLKAGDVGRQRLDIGSFREVAKLAGLYVVVATIIVGFVFVWALDGPNSFARNDDTAVHISYVRGFVDTGFYSSLAAGPYLNLGVEGGFYPAAWHVLVAIIASFFANNVSLAMSAMVVAFIAVVFPLIMLLFFKRFFAQSKIIALAGSLFTAGLCGFPWGFVVFGQLFPNMISFMFIPVAMVVLQEIIDASNGSDRAVYFVLLLACMLGMVFDHTNGLFTLGIWAVLYGMSRFFFMRDGAGPIVTKARVLGALGLFVAACVLWGIALQLPFLQGILGVDWGALLSVPAALVSGLAFMFSSRQGLQPFISIVVLLGVIQTIKNKQYLWLTVAYAAALAMYVMDMSIDVALKQLFTGFWYTDPNRTGAMTAMFAIPLAAMGCCRLVEIGSTLVQKVKGGTFSQEKALRVSAVVCALLFVVSSAIPLRLEINTSYDKDLYFSGLVRVHKEIEYRYSWNEFYTSEESAFVQKVIDTIPEGEVVINVPRDGSGWAYGADGINIYFRRAANNGAGSIKENKIIRLNLRDVATSKEVQDVVEKWDVHYVMYLDDLSSKHPTYNPHRYKEENWVGIEGITEETKGFKLVLSEDDMRLYEIDYNAWK